MKTVFAFAFALLCIAAPLSAGERCTKDHAHRSEIARPLSVKPTVNRVEITRGKKVVTLTAWQRALLFDPQIL